MCNHIYTARLEQVLKRHVPEFSNWSRLMMVVCMHLEHLHMEHLLDAAHDVLAVAARVLACQVNHMETFEAFCATWSGRRASLMLGMYTFCKGNPPPVSGLSRLLVPTAKFPVLSIHLVANFRFLWRILSTMCVLSAYARLYNIPAHDCR